MIRALLLLALVSALPARAAEVDPVLQAYIDANLRAAPNRARDVYRHPGEALTFFGVKPSSTLVEIDPGASAYWTEILAPYLKAEGHYIAAEPPATSDEGKSQAKGFADKVAANAPAFGTIQITTVDAGAPIAAPGSADFVLTFRNLHNWMKKGTAEATLKAFYTALKPGGVLGIVDHRASDATPQDPLAASGYVRQDYAIKLIESVGFKFVAASEANANPKDTKDYAKGVWTLPPTFRLKDVDRAKYQAIGESDRFTLKFVKP